MNESIRHGLVKFFLMIAFVVMGSFILGVEDVYAGACTGGDCCNPSPMGSCYTGPGGGSCCPKCSSGGPGPDGCTCWGGGWTGDCGSPPPPPGPPPCLPSCSGKFCGQGDGCGGSCMGPTPLDGRCCPQERPGMAQYSYSDCGTECDEAPWGPGAAGTGCFQTTTCNTSAVVLTVGGN